MSIFLAIWGASLLTQLGRSHTISPKESALIELENAKADIMTRSYNESWPAEITQKALNQVEAQRAEVLNTFR